MDNLSEVYLTLVPDPDLDVEAGERLTRQLRAEIGELDVDSVARAPAGELPQGAKGVDPVTVGALIVALSASGGVITTLIGTLRDWLERHSRRHKISVTINGDTIELERASARQGQQLIEAFISRHSVE
jgi:hypothetical protein